MTEFEPVDQAAMAGDEVAPILDAAIALLIADMTRPPKKPISTMTSDSSPACSGVNGVIHERLRRSAWR